MLTIRDVGIVPSVERFVSTNYLLRHFVVLALLVILTLLASTLAYALAVHYGHPTQFSSSDPRVGFQAGTSGRDTMDIISACASTLITCVYTSVHFDVPRSYAHRLPLLQKLRAKDYWLELWTKASFWLLAVFSPEMLVLHAFYEHVIAARDVAWMRAHGHAEWSLALAFAADMGALAAEDGHRVRSGFALHEAARGGGAGGAGPAFDCAALEHELADRTKADTLFKALTALQIARFLAGTLARAAKRLPVAPLETVTCAYVLCTLVYYGLWLRKPYNVNERIVVRVKPALARARPVQELVANEAKAQARWKWVPEAVRGFWEKTCVRFIEPPMKDTDRLRGSERLWQTSPYMTQGSLIAAAASLLVGFAHLFCWDVEFPNSNGQVLWRCCTVLLIVLPVIVFVIILGAAILDTRWVTDAMNKMALTLIVIYCIARLILLILLGHSFQSLPAGVYSTQDISWLSFIPFIH
ncbi:hypothetical protein PsYK624_084580 [Phanerochaete sordida]|uniref:Uncharacterized protein n=1 Tax=Phanerochaete sordida TaxID=48140 RepID=A0A9P3LF67_9APHY|nr:hypothetical protein PsYK624_084580 [Phanerochaete sordida]